MKKNTQIKYILAIVTIIIAMFFIGNNDAYALEDVDNYSELYKQYLELSDEEKEKVKVIPDKYSVSLKKYNEQNNKRSARLFRTQNTVPERYSLAEHYNIKVKNQGEEGTCWAFASLETLETYLQIHGFGTFDFSENHLNYIESNLFSETTAERRINSAGSYSDFQEYASKKLGPVSEADYPYYVEEGSSVHKEYSQDELDSLLNATPLAYVGEYVSFPSVNKETEHYSDSELSEYRKNVKKHIMENGAVYTLITAPNYFSGEFYNPNTYSAYFPTTNDYRLHERSHAVAIIGWDDNYSKDNFLDVNKPAHDGAYIALNSWGKNFGDSGLYYISYDDAFVEQNLRGIKEAVTDISELSNTKSFTINDSNLYKALKDFLGRKIVSCDDSTNEITMLNGTLNEILYLDLVNYNITDLSGIENFTNLSSLNLSKNNISNIEPLLALHNLKDLNLRYNNFTTIPEELQNAELSSLALSYNPIEDFSGIANIKSVTNLDLEGTDIKEDDLLFLKNLKIKTLNLSKTNIKDYSTLKTLNDGLEPDGINDFKLLQLYASYNDDIIYSSLPNVNSLNLSHTSFDENKFNQIENTSNLESLDISYTNIKDLGFLSGKNIREINISGNENLQNIDVLKYTSFIEYGDAGLTDLSIFKGFYSSQLNLANNNIEDYSDLLENEYLNYVDLSNNKISETHYSEKPRIGLDGNHIKPSSYYFDSIDSMKKQVYEETLKVDTSRDNNFTEIVSDLKGLYNSGIKLNVTNATIDYENNKFKITDYDKDVIINIENGIYEGSTITYKIEKTDNTSINYIYINRSNLKTTYTEGEQFDATSLKVYAVYDNNSLSEITDFTVTGGENLQVGSNTITIEKDGLADYFEVEVIPNEDIETLTFETPEIYNATLKKIKNLEKERQDYPEYYTHTQILISKDDENKTIKIFKEDLKWISYLEIESDKEISLEDTKQFPELTGLTLNGKNFEDLSIFNYFKQLRDEKQDILPSERLMALEIKNNEKIQKINDDIYRTLSIQNSTLKDINNLTNLISINYKGHEMPEMNDILDSIQMLDIDVTSKIEDLQRDDNLNIILPNLLKEFQDKGLEIEANICDQVRDEQYLNPYNKISIPITVNEEKLILNYDDIKNIEYEGNNQYIEIKIKDINNKYFNFNFKYNIQYKLADDTKPEPQGDEEKTDTEHVHEWGEWTITKQPTETEEGQKERICLKNPKHKEIMAIPKTNTNNTDSTDETETPNPETPKSSRIENIQNIDTEKDSINNNSDTINKLNRFPKNPETGDKITLYIVAFVTSLFGIAIVKKCL